MIIIWIRSLGIDARTLVHDHDAVSVGKVHDFFRVWIVGRPVRIRSDPLDEVVVSSDQSVVHSFPSYLHITITVVIILYSSARAPRMSTRLVRGNVIIFTSESSCRPNPLKYVGLSLMRSEVFVHLIVLMPTGIRYTSSTFQVDVSLI